MTHTKLQLDEIRRCGTDLLHFANNYVKVRSPFVDDPVLFSTFKFQDECLTAFENNRFVIVNKARQLGVSTMSAIYAAWLMLFRRNQNIGYVSPQLHSATMFVKKVKMIIDSIPKWMMLSDACRDNDRTLELKSGSRVVALSSCGNAGCSESFSLIIFEEVAHMTNFETTWSGVYPTLRCGGGAIVTSTPKNPKGKFYEMWQSAIAGENEFKPVMLPWYVHPERSHEWVKENRRHLSDSAFAKEYLCEFREYDKAIDTK